MTSFRFDMGNFNSKCDNIRVNLSKYRNLCEQTYITAKSVTNSWNDPASEAFFSKVQNDEINVSEIYDSLNEYQNNLEYFGNELSNIFSNVGVNTTNLKVNYNTSSINSARFHFNTVKYYIRVAQQAFEDCSVPYGFDNLPVLNEVFNALYNDIGALASTIENRLNNTCDQIEGLINTAQAKNKAVNYVSIDDKLTQVNANVVYMNPVNANLDIEDKSRKINDDIVTTESKDFALNDIDKKELSGTIEESKIDDFVLETKDKPIISGDILETSISGSVENKTDVDSTASFEKFDVDEPKTNIENEDVEVEVSPEIIKPEADISITMPEEENNKIEVESFKVNVDDFVLNKDESDIKISGETINAKNDNPSINTSSSIDDIKINGATVDAKADSFVLENSSFVGDGKINVSSVGADINTGMDLSSSIGPVDIDSIKSEVEINTNLNIEKPVTVTAEDIMNHE